MSGLYLPGMEMPTSCISCLLNSGEKRPEYGLTIYCPYSSGVISWRDRAFDNGRLASCGIVPVPEHGRLIDADAILNSKGVGTQIAGWGKMYHETVIEYAPTIIPASGEET